MLTKSIKIFFILALIGGFLPNIDNASQKKRKNIQREKIIQKEGIVSYDSLFVISGDTSSITIVRNHLMNIEIQGDVWDISRTEYLLGKAADTSGWKTYKSIKFNVIFKYPPSLDIKIDVTNQDTSILLTKKSLDQIYNPQSKRPSKRIFSIRLGNYSFEDIAREEGFSKRQGLWYTEGRAPSQAIFLIGSNWNGLIGDGAYGTQLDNGGFGLAYNSMFFIFKHISIMRSAIFNFFDMDEDIAIGIVSSLSSIK